MFKKFGIAFALLQGMSLCALTGVQLHVKYGNIVVDEDCILIEDNTSKTFPHDSLVVTLEQKTEDDKGLLTIEVSEKDADGKLITIIKPTLVLHKGGEGRLSIADHDGNGVPNNQLTVLASFASNSEHE